MRRQLEKLRERFALWFWPKGHGISVIIPYRQNGCERRQRNLEFLVGYWLTFLPGCEVLISDDPEKDKPFSKSVAINRAAKQAEGDIFVLADADGYMNTEHVLHCASEIRKARWRNQRLWFVPYRRFYRLTRRATDLLLTSTSKDMFLLTSPPQPDFIQNCEADTKIGHQYGAMMQIMPREAFTTVGGWDCRFRGWGGEDHAAMRAVDTLYWPHKTLPTPVFHMWHPQIGLNGKNDWVHWKERMWAGQTDPAVNDRLSWRYYHAFGKPKVMRKLVDEGLRACCPPPRPVPPCPPPPPPCPPPQPACPEPPSCPPRSC